MGFCLQFQGIDTNMFGSNRLHALFFLLLVFLQSSVRHEQVGGANSTVGHVANDLDKSFRDGVWGLSFEVSPLEQREVTDLLSLSSFTKSDLRLPFTAILLRLCKVSLVLFFVPACHTFFFFK